MCATGEQPVEDGPLDPQHPAGPGGVATHRREAAGELARLVDSHSRLPLGRPLGDQQLALYHHEEALDRLARHEYRVAGRQDNLHAELGQDPDLIRVEGGE